jgi:hypothetical protein
MLHVAAATYLAIADYVECCSATATVTDAATNAAVVVNSTIATAAVVATL